MQKVSNSLVKWVDAPDLDSRNWLILFNFIFFLRCCKICFSGWFVVWKMFLIRFSFIWELVYGGSNGNVNSTNGNVPCTSLRRSLRIRDMESRKFWTKRWHLAVLVLDRTGLCILAFGLSTEFYLQNYWLVTSKCVLKRGILDTRNEGHQSSLLYFLLWCNTKDCRWSWLHSHIHILIYDCLRWLDSQEDLLLENQTYR